MASTPNRHTIRLSALFGLTERALQAAGVFDRFVMRDSLLYVDPHLLSRSAHQEMVDGDATMKEYWANTFKLVRAVHSEEGVVYSSALDRFVFPELSEAGLGHARDSTSGSGIGPGFARALLATSRTIIDAGVTDPTLFELLGMFEKGIGSDRVSDMTIYICRHHFFAFTSRICKELTIPTKTITRDGQRYHIPVDPKSRRPMILFPSDVLRAIPTAFDWDDRDTVSSHNAALRRRVSAKIGKTWKKAHENNPKSTLLEVIKEHPELLKDLIDQYRAKNATPYDFVADPLGENVEVDVATAAAANNPIKGLARPKNKDDLITFVTKVIQQFDHLVYNVRLWKLLWVKNKPRAENAAQLLFLAVAECYCEQAGVEVSPETNKGPGPVDFKFSVGEGNRVLVEMKLSSNTKLVHGFEKQLPTYAKAERAGDNFFLIVQTTRTDRSIKTVQQLEAKERKAGRNVPRVFVVDGRKQRSASK